MSDTPETDASLIERNSTVAVDADFARKLERERDEARKERDELRELLTEIRDGEVNAEDEADKFLRDHQPSELSKLRAELDISTRANLHYFGENAALSEEVERANKDNESLAGRLTACELERDFLGSEMERLKAKLQSDFENREREFREMNRVLNGLRGLWKHLPNIENKYDERLACHLDELIERLKADAELYAGWSTWKDGIWRISHSDSGPLAEWIAEDLQSAMKGAE